MAWSCPECGSDNLSVVALVTVTLTQKEGGDFETEANGSNHDWDGDSTMICGDCHHKADSSSFEVQK